MAKKRANGEGNIRKRSDGRWEGRYTAGYNAETGKRIIKNVLGKTQAECKAKITFSSHFADGDPLQHAAGRNPPGREIGNPLADQSRTGGHPPPRRTHQKLLREQGSML